MDRNSRRPNFDRARARAPSSLPDVSFFVIVDPDDPWEHSAVSPEFFELVNVGDDWVPVEAMRNFGTALLELVRRIEEVDDTLRERSELWVRLAVLLGGVQTAAAPRVGEPPGRLGRLIAYTALVGLERATAGLRVPLVSAEDPLAESISAYQEVWEECRELAEGLAGGDGRKARRDGLGALLVAEVEDFYRCRAVVSPAAAIGLYMLVRILRQQYPSEIGCQPRLAVYRNAMEGAEASGDLALRLLTELKRGTEPPPMSLPSPPQSAGARLAALTGLGRRGRTMVVRIAVIGPPAGGKTVMKKVLTQRQHLVEVGATIVWERDPRRARLGPTVEAVVLATGSTRLEAHGEVRVELIDTAGIEVQKDNPDASFLDETSVLDLLILTVPPSTVWGPDPEGELLAMGAAAARVLRHRPCASVAIAYTKLDEVGIAPSSLGRLLDAQTARTLAPLQRDLGRRGEQDFPARLVGALGLDRRFPVEAEREVVKQMLLRTASLWKNVLVSAEVQPPWSFNAYLCVAQSGIPAPECQLRPGVGADLILRDFFARVHQPTWPFWVEGGSRA